MDLNDIDINDLSKEEKLEFVLHALEEAKKLVAVAMQMLNSEIIPKGQIAGWQMLNLLVRQKEKELEAYLDNE